MKRIIQGKLYDTRTATHAARYEVEGDEGIIFECDVYRTPGGAWFEVSEETRPGDEDFEGRIEVRANTEADIQRLVADSDVAIEVLDEELIPLPPEATAEDEEEAAERVAIFVRMPAALKGRIEKAARAAGLSVNAYAITMLDAE